DIYDLLLFAIIRIPSLQSLGLSKSQIASDGQWILNMQMIGLLIGGVLWGILGDKKGRMKVLFASIIIYSLGNIANGFVHTVAQYGTVRFFTGIGLAGELGAGITLVTEILPKEKRGIATSFVAAVGLLGAVVAFLIKEQFSNWRICYYVGGGLGFLLLLLRVSVHESGMFRHIENADISRGNFLMLFTNGRRFRKYLTAILVGLPTWYVIGILIAFSNEFAAKMNMHGSVDPGKAIMISYAIISAGGVLTGYVSKWLKSRKQALYIFYSITAIGIVWFFNLQNAEASRMYMACAVLGFGVGFWSIFVTMAAEQFGTNIRATVATTVPNMIRGSLVLITALFNGLQAHSGYVTSGWITGIVTLVIGLAAVMLSEETYHKDLNYVEEFG
ncbi:MAG TPA: MFS transporter, partial [Chitinophagaceae bacterium]|nr:MFS transporter [Chitinophagaceae bacterium]